MSISDILSEEEILLEWKPDNKRGLLAMIASHVAEKYNLDKSMIFEAILERENLGSTGYGHGVAFPHTRISDLQDVITLLIRLDQPIEYDAADGKPVDIIAFLISPENRGDDHLRVLSAFSRCLNDDEVCRQIREAKTAHGVYTAML